MKQLPSPSEKKQVNKENANLLVDRAFADLKTVLYEHYELLLKAIRKYPQSFDSDALFELNRLMAMPTIEFKKQRSARHILKIAYLHYILQKDLIRARIVR